MINVIKLNRWRKKIWQSVAILTAVVAIGFLFQNCAKNPNLSQPGQQTSNASLPVGPTAAPLTASINPSTLSANSGTTLLTTNSATVNVSGGVAPYNYNWSFSWATNADGATATIGSSNSATSDFSATGVLPGNTDTGVATCTITDANGQTATASVNIAFTYSATAISITAEDLKYSNQWGGGVGYATQHFAYSGGALNSDTGFVNGIAPVQVAQDSSGAYLALGNFTADPGQSSLVSITVNGVTLSGSTAQYNYYNGVAQWSWFGKTFNFSAGGQYSGYLSSNGSAW